MKTYGIRISDSKDGILNVKITDILQEIQNGDTLNWCILFLDGTPNQEKGQSINQYKNKINKSESGLQIDWNEIYLIGKKFSQTFETTILGSKTREFLHRYENDQEMYQLCDVVIEQIDCAFWQIFSKDLELINKLKAKFKETEILEPNFEK
jgi:hypothetical protein